MRKHIDIAIVIFFSQPRCWFAFIISLALLIAIKIASVYLQIKGIPLHLPPNQTITITSPPVFFTMCYWIWAFLSVGLIVKTFMKAKQKFERHY